MPSKRRSIAATGVLWIILSFLIYLILNPTFLIPPLLPLNLSFLTIPILASLGILFVSMIVRLTVPKKPWNAIAMKGLSGLILLVLVTLLFEETTVPATFTIAFHPLQLTILSCAGSAVVNELSKVYRKLGLILTTVSTVILGYSLYTLSHSLSAVWKPIAYISLPLLVGSIAGGITVLFGLFKDVDRPSISGLLEWVSRGRLMNFFLAFLFTGYVFHLRPYILERAPLVVILEWVIVSLVVAVMYASAKSLSKQLHVDLEYPKWEKHAQKVKRQEGDAFRRELYFQELFVDQGIKTPLLVHYMLSLRDLESSEEKIVEAVQQLVAYRDARPVSIALPWVKKKVEEKNRNARKQIVENLTAQAEARMRARERKNRVPEKWI